MLDVRDAAVAFERPALRGVDLRVAEGEIVAILGPSGSGKSTLLRSIAGLQTLDRGTISWRGQDMARVPVHRRPFGLMFQDYALFPHLDVAANVAFGLRMTGHPDPEGRVDEVLALVGMRAFAHRGIGELSGGEQQRVALARALAPAPELLMLDEPVGSLDRRLREELVAELDELLRALAITTVYVTHDQDESLRIADRIVVMRDGGVVQHAPPEVLWRRPADAFVARFLGLPNIVPGHATPNGVDTPLGRLPVATELSGPVSVLLPDDAIAVAPDGPIEGFVERVRFVGGRRRASLAVGALSLQVEHDLRGASAGDPIRLRIEPTGIHVMPAESG